jgi:hypothetical protein
MNASYSVFYEDCALISYTQRSYNYLHVLCNVVNAKLLSRIELLRVFLCVVLQNEADLYRELSSSGERQRCLYVWAYKSEIAELQWS